MGQGPLRPDVHLRRTARSSRCTSSASAATRGATSTSTIYDVVPAPAAAEPVHVGQRHPAGAVAVHLRGATSFCSLFCGKKAGRNPWHSNTLEWAAPSPPPHGNFEDDPGRLPRALRVRCTPKRQATTCRKPIPPGRWRTAGALTSCPSPLVASLDGDRTGPYPTQDRTAFSTPCSRLAPLLGRADGLRCPAARPARRRGDDEEGRHGRSQGRFRAPWLLFTSHLRETVARLSDRTRPSPRRLHRRAPAASFSPSA